MIRFNSFFSSNVINRIFRSSILFISAVICFTAVSASRPAAAASYSYPSYYIDIEVPDDTIVLTPETSKISPLWEDAGINNPKKTLDEFKNMNVLAAFCNPSTRQMTKFIFNRKDETVSIFSFENKSDNDIISYVNSIMASALTEEMTLDISVDRTINEIPFFRMVLDATESAVPCTEIIYGTVANGAMYQFDVFFEGRAEVSDDYLKTIVSGIKFTSLLTFEEYEKEVNAGFRKLIITIVVFIAVFGLLIFTGIRSGKRRNRLAKSISDAMTDFRTRARNGEIDTNAKPLYTVSTTYDKALMEEYGTYSAWFKFNPGFLFAIIVLVTMTVLLFKLTIYLLAILMAVIAIVVTYMHYTQAEKAKDALAKRYDVKSKPTATYRFYSEYFTVSGLATANEYIYPQITKIASFGNSVYLFAGDVQALIIRKNELGDLSVSELKKFIRNH